MHEDQRTPAVHGHRDQPAVLAAEILDPLELRHAAQLSAQVVGPAVVAATEPPGVSLRLGDDARCPVTADVEEGAEVAHVVPQHEHRLAGDVSGDEVPRLLQLIHPGDELPAVAEDAAALQRVDPRVAVPGRGQRAGPLQRNGRVERRQELLERVVHAPRRLIPPGAGPEGRFHGRMPRL